MKHAMQWKPAHVPVGPRVTSLPGCRQGNQGEAKGNQGETKGKPRETKGKPRGNKGNQEETKGKAKEGGQQGFRRWQRMN